MKTKMLLAFGGILAVLGQSLAVGAEAKKTVAAAPAKAPRLSAKQIFDYKQPVIFQDNFQSGQFGKWGFSENANYGILKATPKRISIVDAPGLAKGRKAVRFAVQRAPDSFRSEISLPHEPGFRERWYGERIFVPNDWVFDPNRGADIVMQWHAIPGNWRATFPNLVIAIDNTSWIIRQSHGSAQTKPTRTQTKLAEPVQRGAWVSWVIHAKWSPRDNGLIQIWKDGKLVAELKGPNVYSTIGEEYTPYLKTGIYHPEWHMDKDGKREAFDKETPGVTTKVIYATDIKIGSEKAKFEDIVPKP
jgi:hypothetical protein